MRNLHQQKQDWDEKIDLNFQNQCEKALRCYDKAEEIFLPRAISIGNQSGRLVSCDASEKALGVVVYWQVGHDLQFVSAKSKIVPPMKTKPNEKKELTIPRLELQAAAMAVRFADSLPEKLKFHPICLCFDLQITIDRILGDPHRHTPFEKYRLLQIRKSSTPEQWLHVPTKENGGQDQRNGSQKR